MFLYQVMQMREPHKFSEIEQIYQTTKDPKSYRKLYGLYCISGVIILLSKPDVLYSICKGMNVNIFIYLDSRYYIQKHVYRQKHVYGLLCIVLIQKHLPFESVTCHAHWNCHPTLSSLLLFTIPLL